MKDPSVPCWIIFSWWMMNAVFYFSIIIIPGGARWVITGMSISIQHMCIRLILYEQYQMCSNDHRSPPPLSLSSLHWNSDVLPWWPLFDPPVTSLSAVKTFYKQDSRMYTQRLEAGISFTESPWVVHAQASKISAGTQILLLIHVYLLSQLGPKAADIVLLSILFSWQPCDTD